MRNVAVIGSGGREHAIARKLSESKHVEKVFAIPGNDGMRDVAEVFYRVKESDFEAIGGICIENKIELVIIGPEGPLSEGLADYLIDEHDLKVFGPRKDAAQMESSKKFTKDLMKKYNIPTARYETFTEIETAKAYIESIGAPIVLKKDGLAGGKGVIVAQTLEEALEGLDELFSDKDSDAPIVIEEFLEGEEFSLMVLVNEDFSHSFEIIAQDHKRAYEGDVGPNTGGMGAYAPVTHIGESIRKEAVEKIVIPTTQAMVNEGLNYVGVLYLGAMATSDGVKVIEFNARFGDPEAQILLSMMEDDFVEILDKVFNKESFKIHWKTGALVGVMLASNGYPKAYEKGKPVDISAVEKDSFVSGIALDVNGNPVTSGGRVVLVTGYGDTIEEAVNNAYKNVDKVKFDDNNLFYRNDIAHKALQ